MQNDIRAAGPKIITVTANTAIDFIITVNNFTAGTNMVADSTVKFAAGKAINVAKATASLGYPATIMGFVGAQSIARFEALKSDLISTDFTSVSGTTRTNITVSDKQSETHIRTAGYLVNATDCQKLSKRIALTVEESDIVVLAGSLPTGAPDDLFKNIIELCHEKSAITFLDSSGECLRQGIKARPYLVKPNQQELEELHGQHFVNEDQLISAANRIIDQDVQRVAVSRGSKGMVLVDKNNCYNAIANIDIANPVSTIGCGDAMLAGFAVAKMRGLGLTDFIKLGVASATANLFSFEPGNLNNNQAASISPHVLISRM